MANEAKAKKPLYNKWWFLVVVVLLVGVVGAGLSGCGETAKQPPTGQTETQVPAQTPESSETQGGDPAETTPEPEAESAEPSESSEPDIALEFDALQNGFISISENTTIEEILSFIDENSLFYTMEEYNKPTGGKTVKYKVAYEKGVSYQSHADSGDCLEISFDKDNDDKILNAEYVNSNSYGYTALFYNYGIWYRFSNENAENYSGYYNVKSLGGNNEGIVVKYNNGNEAHTNYFPCNSPEEAIENILKGIGG